MLTRPLPKGAQPLAILRGAAELRTTVEGWRRQGETLGLVPTMGALHNGHLELVRRASVDCDRVITTLFINPKQFNRSADLASYPRDEARDAQLLQRHGVDILFAPSLEEVYPAEFATKVALPALTDCLCGAARPGHMDGVATVVAKLLLQSLPDRAYFGEKDFQQLIMIQQMVRDLAIPVRIVGVPTVREADGLPLSSRNFLLSAEARAKASKLYPLLSRLAAQLAEGREATAALLAEGTRQLQAAGFEPIDYLELREPQTLRSLPRADRPARLFVAAWLGDVRLIDNLPVIPCSGGR